MRERRVVFSYRVVNNKNTHRSNFSIYVQDFFGELGLKLMCLIRYKIFIFSAQKYKFYSSVITRTNEHVQKYDGTDEKTSTGRGGGGVGRGGCTPGVS